MAIREASHGLESYSPYLDKDLANQAITDIGDLLLPFGNTQKVLKMIQEEAQRILGAQKRLFAIGGEHLISIPLIQQYFHLYPDLVVFQFDAHADLRDEYLGETFSHATVMRRISDFIGGKRVYQFAIRSGTQDEFHFGRTTTNFFPGSLQSLPDVLAAISKTTPLYVTFDLDVFDPAALPGTGTPEPGGIQFSDFVRVLELLRAYSVVGVDVVELAPHYDPSAASALLAAKVLRELLLL